MVVSLRGVKAASRRLRGGLRASLDPSTLKDAVFSVSGCPSARLITGPRDVGLQSLATGYQFGQQQVVSEVEEFDATDDGVPTRSSSYSVCESAE
jgi:hypothetical protein